MTARRVVIRALLLGLAIVFGVHSAVLAEKNPPSKPIDLNVANIKELQELPGIGAVTAQRIIDLRQKSGRFRRVEDLLAVRGISPKKLDAMRKYVTVSAAPAAVTPAKKPVPPAKNSSSCSGCSTPNNK
ncbi:MAG TPA: helix-hairpin-helix domain-containing protein [Candidatus Acidoferrales bacterium]|nr:helix-hairpin-helix domain-containing protein [Candidatus Acidoferrales bacterium]